MIEFGDLAGPFPSTDTSALFFLFEDLFSYLLFMCMGVLLTWLSVQYVCAHLFLCDEQFHQGIAETPCKYGKMSAS